MKDKQEILKYVAKQLNVAEKDLIWSPKCVNHTQGFTKDYDLKTLVPNSLGYWVRK